MMNSTLTVVLPALVNRYGWSDWNQIVNSLQPKWVQAGIDDDGFPIWINPDTGEKHNPTAGRTISAEDWEVILHKIKQKNLCNMPIDRKDKA